MNRRSFLGLAGKVATVLALAPRAEVVPSDMPTSIVTPESAGTISADNANLIFDESRDLYLEMFKRNMLSIDALATRLQRDAYAQAILEITA